MTKPLILKWFGFNLGFSLEGGNGKVKLSYESEDVIQINVQFNGEGTPLGTLNVQHGMDQPNAVTFSCYGAAPNIRFKYLGTNMTRQVAVPLFRRTAFHIICPENVVKAVMIVDNNQ